MEHGKRKRGVFKGVKRRNYDGSNTMGYRPRQQENKAKAHEAQKRDEKDIENLLKNNVFELQQMYQRMNSEHDS